MSGYQDSNLGPPAPKAGALTGLCYTPNAVPFGFAIAKLWHLFGLCKYFWAKFLDKFCNVLLYKVLYSDNFYRVIGCIW